MSRTSGWDHRALAVFTSLCCKSLVSTPTCTVRNNLQGISLPKYHCGKSSKGQERMGRKSGQGLYDPHGCSCSCCHQRLQAQNTAESSETNFLHPQSQGAELRARPTQGHLGRTEGQPKAQKRVYNPIKGQIMIPSAKIQE